MEINPKISSNGLVYRYEEDQLEKVRSCNLDLLVRCCSGILKGEILSVCKLGIISFHHGDNEKYRGGPAAFWETRFKEPKIGFIIQILSEELDGGDVLFKGFIQSSWLYTLNLAKLYEMSNPVMALVIDDLTSNLPKLQIHNKKPFSFTLYTIPTLEHQFAYLIHALRSLSLKIYRKFLGRKWRWSVAYQYSDSLNNINLAKSIEIPNPPRRGLADPFIVKNDNKHYCFMEEFDFDSGKGTICAYLISNKGFCELGTALKETFHLSYPFIFEYENELYMCPDTSEINEIRLYKCVQFPLNWELCTTLMSDISAVDTNIFYRENKWWMMTNISSSRIGDHSSELHIFSSNNPLSKCWEAHEKNPVIFDSSKARNGGFIVDQSEQFRVFQRQGFDLYGQSLGVAKIENISLQEYNETTDFLISPTFFKGIHGIHSYNYKDGLLVFDLLRNSNYRK